MSYNSGICFLLKTPPSLPSNKFEVSCISASNGRHYGYAEFLVFSGFRLKFGVPIVPTITTVLGLRRIHIIVSPVYLRGQWPPFPDRTKCTTINFNDNVGDVQNNVNKRVCYSVLFFTPHLSH